MGSRISTLGFLQGPRESALVVPARAQSQLGPSRGQLHKHGVQPGPTWPNLNNNSRWLLGLSRVTCEMAAGRSPKLIWGAMRSLVQPHSRLRAPQALGSSLPLRPAGMWRVEVLTEADWDRRWRHRADRLERVQLSLWFCLAWSCWGWVPPAPDPSVRESNHQFDVKYKRWRDCIIWLAWAGTHQA